MPGVASFIGAGFRPASSLAGNPVAALGLLEVQMRMTSAARKRIPNPITQYPLGFPPIKDVEKLFANEGKSIHNLFPPARGTQLPGVPPVDPRDTRPLDPLPSLDRLPSSGTGFEDEDIARFLKREIRGLLRGELDTVTPGKIVRTSEEAVLKQLIGDVVSKPFEAFNWFIKGSSLDPTGRSEIGTSHVGIDGVQKRLDDVWDAYRRGQISAADAGERQAAIRAQASEDVYAVWIEFLRRIPGFDGLPPTGSGPPGSADP